MKKLLSRIALLISATVLTLFVLAIAPREALANPPFSDVDSSTAHQEDIIWMHEEGYATGFDDDTFRPYAEIARCDMAAFLYRMAGRPNYTPSEADKKMFTDVTSSTPHAKEVWWLAHMGISTGFPDGTFRPYETVKRCDMAAFLYRMEFGPHFELSAMDKAAFPDVTITTPHADPVWWLALNEISKGYPDGTFRPYSAVTRCDMAAFLHRMKDKGMISVMDFDMIADKEAEGYVIVIGDLRVYDANEMCAIQGLSVEMFDPMIPPSSFYACVMFDREGKFSARPQDSTTLDERDAILVCVAKREEYPGSVQVPFGDIAWWNAYKNERVVIGIDPYDTWWPSDISLPGGQPRTKSAVLIFTV